MLTLSHRGKNNAFFIVLQDIQTEVLCTVLELKSYGTIHSKQQQFYRTNCCASWTDSAAGKAIILKGELRVLILADIMKS